MDNRHTQYFPLSLSTRSQFTCSYNISMSKCLFESNFFKKKKKALILTTNLLKKKKGKQTKTNKMKLKTAVQLTYFFILFLIFRITFVTVFKGHLYRSMHNTKYIWHQRILEAFQQKLVCLDFVKYYEIFSMLSLFFFLSRELWI